MAARNTLWTPEIVRQRIQASQIMNRLQDHILGLVELSPTQIRAAEILLRKTVPDLTAIQHSGTIGVEKPEELNDSVLAHIALRGRNRDSEEKGSPEELSELH